MEHQSFSVAKQASTGYRRTGPLPLYYDVFHYITIYIFPPYYAAPYLRPLMCAVPRHCASHCLTLYNSAPETFV